MAEIRPFRAWRYNKELIHPEDIITPFFDVTDSENLNPYYKNPYHSVHLSFPSLEKSGMNITAILQSWMEKKIIVQDPLPAIYVYYQYYNIPETTELQCRKGFIATIKLSEWEDKIILPHENVMGHAIEDRLKTIEQSQMNLSSTHGLYADPKLNLEQIMDECISCPVYEGTDSFGVLHKLGMVQDLKVIEKFEKILADKQVIIADGHHRYHASLAYKRQQQSKDPHYNENNAYNFHCMYLTNSETDLFEIYPIHRLIVDLPGFNQTNFLEDVKKYFEIIQITNEEEIPSLIKDHKWQFGLILKDQNYIIRLKPENFADLHWNFPLLVKELDLTVLHFFIFEKIMGIKASAQKKWKNIIFSSNFNKSIAKIKNNEAQFVIITQGIDINKVKEIAFSGYVFPQKSTSFYPKVVNGLLYHSINTEEEIINIKNYCS